MQWATFCELNVWRIVFEVTPTSKMLNYLVVFIDLVGYSLAVFIDLVGYSLAVFVDLVGYFLAVFVHLVGYS